MTVKRIKTRQFQHWCVLATALLLLTSVIAYNLQAMYRQVIQQEQQRLLAQARTIAKHVEHHLASVTTILQGVAKDYQTTWAKHDIEHTSYHLKILSDAIPGIRATFITNENGLIVSASRAEIISHDISARQYFITSKHGNVSDCLYISPPYTSFFDKYVFNISKVIQDKSGTFHGLATAAINTELFANMLQAGIYADDIWIYIVHGNGIQFASYPATPASLDRNLAKPGTLFSSHISSGQTESIIHSQASAGRQGSLASILTIQPVGLKMDHPLVLVVSRSSEAVLKNWKREKTFQLAMLVLTITISITGLFLFHRHKEELELKAARADDLVLLRYQLLEYATMATSEELLQYSLDEICKLSNSPIGFYHFIDHDQLSITMQAWSIKVRSSSCRLTGHKHYPVDKAGIWTDCIKTRAPVIHNDYAAIKHKKGLPDGHVKLLRELVVPIIRDERVVAVMGVGNKQTEYSTKDAEEVLYLADVAWEILETRQAQEDLKRANELLENQARIDFLTGIYNRRMFDTLLTSEMGSACRHKAELSLIILDIDHFKQVNDNHGHAIGDKMLKGMAELVEQRLRSYDIFCRWGGEEFVILCPKTEAAKAALLADLLRSLIEAKNFGDGLKATASFGVTQYRQDEMAEDFISRADDALYMAKRNGRNRVEIL